MTVSDTASGVVKTVSMQAIRPCAPSVQPDSYISDVFQQAQYRSCQIFNHGTGPTPVADASFKTTSKAVHSEKVGSVVLLRAKYNSAMLT